MVGRCFKGIWKIRISWSLPSTKQAVSWTTVYEHQSSNLEEFVIPSIKAPSKKEVTTTTSLKEKKANDDEIQRCRKIRIKPTREQKKIFQRWFGVCRFVYNKTLNMIHNHGYTSWMDARFDLLSEEERSIGNLNHLKL